MLEYTDSDAYILTVCMYVYMYVRTYVRTYVCIRETHQSTVVRVKTFFPRVRMKGNCMDRQPWGKGNMVEKGGGIEGALINYEFVNCYENGRLGVPDRSGTTSKNPAASPLFLRPSFRFCAKG